MPDACHTVATELARVPQIITIGTQLHQAQITFHMIGRDTSEIERLLSTTAASIETIKAAHVRIVLSNYKHSLNSGPIVEVKPDFDRRLRELTNTRLSEMYAKRELSVLAMLHGDGRMSLREVARQLDYPESQVRTIFRKLENAPGILNYQTIVNPRALGRRQQARRAAERSNYQTIVNPRALGHRYVHQVYVKANYCLLPGIVKQLKNMPEVIGLVTLSGPMNLALSITVPSRAGLQALVTERIPLHRRRRGDRGCRYAARIQVRQRLEPAPRQWSRGA